MKHLLILMLTFIFIGMNSLDAKAGCATCNEEVAANDDKDNPDRLEAIDRFCFKFFAAESRMFYGVIKEIEATRFSVDEFLTVPVCRLEEAAGKVRSPMLHVIADDPAKHEKFLNILLEYYTKKRKDPGKYITVLNAKNNQGETLLDYMETISRGGLIYGPPLQPYVNSVINFACSTGGVYSRYKDSKACP